jgi:hypothetical protein
MGHSTESRASCLRLVAGTVVVAALTAGCCSCTSTAAPSSTAASTTAAVTSTTRAATVFRRSATQKTIPPHAPTTASTSVQPPPVDSPRYAPPAPTLSFGCVGRDGLPDARCTPGATDPRVTEATISATICVVGYAKKVRPSTSVTTPIKRTELVAYGTTGPLSAYELDHLIPLELGGAPAAVANLWPEPWNGTFGAHRKDTVENHLHARVCAHRMQLADAQRAIAIDWRTADR